MMNRATELFFEHQKSISQFAYFQLGVAASAIAFAVHQTKDQALQDTPWPIGAAVVLWALSFALGSFGIGARVRGLAANTQLLFAKEGFPPEWISALEQLPDYKKSVQTVDNAAQRPGGFFRWQMTTLFFGAIAYVAGHVMHMAAITPAG